MKGGPANVRVLAGVKKDFFHRYRKDRPRAEAAWKALVAQGARLAKDCAIGDAIQRDRWPRRFRTLPTLWRLELPNGFRALYTVFHVPSEGRVARIDWVGDHRDYDDLFGYATS